MGKVNWKRIILGGLLAGLVVNLSEALVDGVILKKEWMDAMTALGKTMDLGGSIAVISLGLVFLIGCLTIWLYAGIHPRYGPGPKTALRVAFAVWVLNWVPATVGMITLGLFPARLLLIDAVVGLPVVVLATLLGAWVYKEA